MSKARYLTEDGKVMEVDPVDLAKWYMECRRKGSFRKAPPGTCILEGVDFSKPLHEYDDPEYFLGDLVRKCSGEMKVALRAEVEEFLEE